MSQAKVVLFCAVVGFAFSGCAPKEKDHEPLLQVDAPFQTLVRAFEQASAVEGSPVVINDLVVGFGQTQSMNETGVCQYAENETPRIVINERIWNTLNDFDRQEVMFHELGHCVLKRIHQNGEMLAYNNSVRIAASVMYPYRIAGSVYRDNIVHYHDELFDPAKKDQF